MGELEGIASNRIFIHHCYIYYKMKEEISSVNCENRQKTEYESIEHYLLALNECIQKILKHYETNQEMRDYLDYIRWNHIIIKDKLTEWQNQNDSNLASLWPIMEICEHNIESITTINFNLSETDNAIINEYIHAYELAITSDNQKPKVYKQAAKLYINYINMLKNKRFVNKTDRDGVTFTQLDAEAMFLIEKLSNIDKVLATDIKLANESYADFRYQDSALKAAQDQAIKDALFFAHKRATETFLESALRIIDETIEMIRKILRENIHKIMEVSSVLFSPFIHPINSAKAMVNFVRHPINSAKEIWNYAKENPYKMAAIIFGGIILGSCCGGLLAIGAVAAIDALLVSVAITSYTTWAVIGVAGGVAGMITYTQAVAGSKIAKLKYESNLQIAEQEMKKNSLVDVNEKEGEKVARESVYDNHIRESMRQAKEEAEENVKQMKMEEHERNRQLKNMNNEQLNSLQLDITTANQELSVNLKSVKEELYQKRQQMRQMQANVYTVQKGRTAAENLMQDIADRNIV